MKVLYALRRSGVLGINRRNAEFTLRWNPRSAPTGIFPPLQAL
jgi:hypothetical protein